MADPAGNRGGECVLYLTRQFAHPPERVFAAWSDPAQLVQWWGPRGFSVAHSDIDARPGGRWQTTLLSPEGSEHHVSGEFIEISAPRRLVFTWAWSENGIRGHETTVTVELRPRDGGTELTLSQQEFESGRSRDLHGDGWRSSLDSLADYL